MKEIVVCEEYLNRLRRERDYYKAERDYYKAERERLAERILDAEERGKTTVH